MYVSPCINCGFSSVNSRKINIIRKMLHLVPAFAKITSSPAKITSSPAKISRHIVSLPLIVAVIATTVYSMPRVCVHCNFSFAYT